MILSDIALTPTPSLLCDVIFKLFKKTKFLINQNTKKLKIIFEKMYRDTLAYPLPLPCDIL
jgi:hypothetical protein